MWIFTVDYFNVFELRQDFFFIFSRDLLYVYRIMHIVILFATQKY